MKYLYYLVLSIVVSACGYVVINNEMHPYNLPVAPKNPPESDNETTYATGLSHPAEGWQETAEFDVVATMETLPNSYDWNDEARLQPIRNQGGCGSCWSFATVAVVESLTRITKPIQDRVDFSEQHLVSSCCNEGTCSGGFFTAFNCIKVGVPDESFDPYLARNSACKAGGKAVATVTRWAYVGDKHGASTDQIKAAILKHGPVAVDVDGSGAFQSYKSGVFTACGSSSTNHMTVLDGWVDDAKYGGGGYWLMRNSWGKGWGEKGYMRIAYKARDGSKCNGIGNYAAYAVVDGIEDLQEHLGMK